MFVVVVLIWYYIFTSAIMEWFENRISAKQIYPLMPSALLTMFGE